MEEKAKNVFDAMVDEYDAWYESGAGRPLYESELRCLEPLVAGRPVLEIGVGTGRFAMCFPGSFGVDTSSEALKIARERGVRVVSAKGEKLPFTDRTFGTVLIVATLCFVTYPLRVLQEARRVLGDDGRAVIGTIPLDSPWGALYEEKRKSGKPFYAGARFYTHGELERLLGKAGLRVTRMRSTLFRGPDEPRRAEEPVEGYVGGAGFVAIEAGR